MGGMNRRQVAQEPPRDLEELSGFPTAELGDDSRLYRAHRRTRSPWFNCQDLECRFDLIGSDGTCYLADDSDTAIRESLGPKAVTGGVFADLADQKVVTALRVPPAETADITDRDAVRYGITRELCTLTDYTLTQAWAEAFHALGLDGIRYSSRLTTEPGPNSWALFGPAGVQGGVTAVETTPGRIAARNAGIEVIDVPPAWALVVQEPPA